jgi:ER-derived vesicles protein
MAQIRGGSGYGLGGQPSFGPQRDDGADKTPVDSIREYTSKIEDVLDAWSEPIKPYVNTPSHPRRTVMCLEDRVPPGHGGHRLPASKRASRQSS